MLKDQQEAKISELKKVSSLIEVEMDTLAKHIDKVKRNDEKNQEEIIRMNEETYRLKGEVRQLQKEFDEKEDEKERVEKEQAMNESRLKLLIDEESATRTEHRKNENETLLMQK